MSDSPAHIQPNVYLVAGYPGAGKTLFTKIACRKLHASVVSLDEIFVSMDAQKLSERISAPVLQKGLSMALEKVRDGEHVMVDSFFKDPDERRAALAALSDHAHVFLIDITTPLEICKERALRRPLQMEPEAFDYLHDIAREPSLAEGFRGIYYFDNLTDIERQETESGIYDPAPAVRPGPAGHMTDAQLEQSLRRALTFAAQIAAETLPEEAQPPSDRPAYTEKEVRALIDRAASW